MGQAGRGARYIKRPAVKRKSHKGPHPWEQEGLTRAERVILFCESLPLSAGKWAGTKFRFRDWQRREIEAIYRTDDAGQRVVRRVCWSMGRGNGKSQIAALLCLCHLVGPEAEPRGEVYVAANDKFQAGRLFSECAAIVERVDWIAARVSIRRHVKELEDIGGTDSLFAALSADVPSKAGLSPSFIVYDELSGSQSRGLLDMLETSMGKREEPLLLVISTQAATDSMPMSEMVDYGLKVQSGEIDDPSFHLVLHAADPGDDPWSVETWKKANPGLGDICSLEHVERFATHAKSVPSAESAFFNLHLNMRVAVADSFIAPSVWKACGTPVDADALARVEVNAGLDLSSSIDLTALVLIGVVDKKKHVLCTFFLPREGLVEKAKADRAPYDQWAREGILQTTPGKTISYEYLAQYLRSVFDRYDIKKLAFDAWGMTYFKPWLYKAGFTEQFVEEHFVEFRQGWKTMSPAIQSLEQSLIEGEIAHGNNPILNMCQSHAVVVADSAGNRVLDKDKSTGRIDGMVALVMANAMMPLATQREVDFDNLIIGIGGGSDNPVEQFIRRFQR